MRFFVKSLYIACFSVLIFGINGVYAQSVNLNLTSNDRLKIKKTEPIKEINDTLYKSEKEKKEYAFQSQKQLDVEDIKLLWESSVERNTVIRFALKKLAMPAEHRRIHSSIMAKSVSALISGVAILPGVFGADSLSSTASMAGGNLARRVISKKGMPKEIPLTDTELIHLAGLIENLQNKIIKDYYEYKSGVESLKVCRQNLMRENKNYSNALKSKNEIDIIVASAKHDKELLNELKLKQKIKLYRLELERLAGDKSVSDLNLIKVSTVEYKGTQNVSKK